MTTLIAFIFRLALLAVFTFAFLVLFQYGTANYTENAKREWDSLLALAQGVKPAAAPTSAVPDAAPVNPPAVPAAPQNPGA